MNIDIDWLGHATFKIKNSVVIYTDPFVLSGEDKADLILITHDHFDHFDKEKIKSLMKEDTAVVCTTTCARQLEGAERLTNGQEKTIKGVSIKAVPAYNVNKFKSPGQPFHPKGEGNGYLISIEGTTIYLAGDTDFIPEMNNLGKVDIALLPVGGTYTMNEPEALEAVKAIKPRYVIPMHYGTLEQTVADAPGFKSMVESEVEGVRVILLG